MELHFSDTEMEDFLKEKLYHFKNVTLVDERTVFPPLVIKVAYKFDSNLEPPADLDSHPELYKVESVFHYELKKAILRL